MKIERIMTREVRSIGPEESLHTAARIMWENDCGCLPVVDEDGRVLAMLTDRDVCMAAWSRNRPLAELPVRGAMSGHLITCSPGDPPAAAQRLMQEHQVRRLPVTDATGRLLGLLSLNDLAREAVHEHEHRHREVSEEEVARTLAAVSRPHVCRLPALRSAAASPGRQLVATV